MEVQYFSKHPTFLLNRTDSIHQRISRNCDDNLYYEHDCAIKDTNGIAVQTKVRNQRFRITERKRLYDRALMKSWISNCNTRGAIKSFSANTYLSTIAQTLWAVPFPVSFPIWKVIISLFKCAHWSSHKKCLLFPSCAFIIRKRMKNERENKEYRMNFSRNTPFRGIRKLGVGNWADRWLKLGITGFSIDELSNNNPPPNKFKDTYTLFLSLYTSIYNFLYRKWALSMS